MLTAPVRETALVETTANVASQKTRLNPLEDVIIPTAREILLCVLLILAKSLIISDTIAFLASCTSCGCGKGCVCNKPGIED